MVSSSGRIPSSKPKVKSVRKGLIVIIDNWEEQEQKSWGRKPHVDQSRSHALTIWLIVTSECGMQLAKLASWGSRIRIKVAGDPALSIGEPSITLDRRPWLRFVQIGSLWF